MKWKQMMSLALASAMVLGLCPQDVAAVQDTKSNVTVVQESNEKESVEHEHIIGRPRVLKKYQSGEGMSVFSERKIQNFLASNEGIALAYVSNDSPEVMAKVQEIAQECRDAGMEDEWDIALWLHDWLIYNADYDLTYSIYHAYGVLLEGTGVCQSYAEAYQLLLNEFGIENMLVTSMEMNHAWNMVKINGVWCHVDCTWDDPISYDENGNEVAGGYESQIYFGLSDAEMSADHVWVEAHYPKCTSSRNSIILRGPSINVVENVEELEELFLNMYELQATYFECYYVGADENFSLVDEMANILFYEYDNLLLDCKLWYSEDYVMVYTVFDEFTGEHTHRYKGLPLEPYCEVSGGILYKCACGSMYESDFTEASEHEWSDWVVTKQPTLSTPGTRTRSCDVCWAEEYVEIVAGNLTGTCGENLKWELNADGVLTISGTGDMYDMEYAQPWEDYAADIVSIVIENGVTSIGNSAFYLCTNMTSIEIPNSVTSIGEYAFNNCKSLTNVKIPNSITTISLGAFYYCENLKKVEIPSSVTSIEAMAFCGCYSLENVEIPSGVTILAGGAFEWCYGLTHMEIPDGITAIESGVFWGCENLESVKIPASVTIIDECAFLYCENLTDVYYGGTEEMWSEIYFGPYTDEVQNATIHFEGQGGNQGGDENTEVTDVFADVFTNDWFVNSVQFVYDNGMMSGSDGSFRPNDNMTRAMMVTTLYRLAGAPTVTDYTALYKFSDVYADMWYTDAVCWAYNTGVTTGYPALGMFGTDDSVTREQLATFLYRYTDNCGLSTSKRGDLSELLNAEQVSSYAKESIEWAVGVGLISGIEYNVNGVIVYDLAPQGSATRAQLATILMRFCNYYGI